MAYLNPICRRPSAMYFRTCREMAHSVDYSTDDQLNTPYPSTRISRGSCARAGFNAEQADLSIALASSCCRWRAWQAIHRQVE